MEIKITKPVITQYFAGLYYLLAEHFGRNLSLFSRCLHRQRKHSPKDGGKLSLAWNIYVRVHGVTYQNMVFLTLYLLMWRMW
jgi:hypothetical protein